MENRRHIYFIKKKFQRNFILKFCGLIVIGAVISGSIIYAMSISTVTTTFENSRLIMKSTADFILPAVLLASVVMIVLIGLATIAATLFTSHRIAGPLYRLEKDIEEITSGNLKKRFHLRKTDEIKALAESLNNMAETLRSDIDKVKNGISDLESGAVSGEMKDRLKNIKALLAKFIT
ncbi:MAG: HAMP domain-containing protein [Candidatus Omnitrophota bacterium]|nr:HAMP domain-containing protein [Candidatus Omnitrophota bacterium]